MSERPDTPRQKLLDALLVERFTPYRPPTAQPVQPARSIRLIVDNTNRRAS